MKKPHQTGKRRHKQRNYGFFCALSILKRLQDGGQWTYQEMSEHFEISTASVDRAISLLRRAGFNIKNNYGQGYYLSKI